MEPTNVVEPRPEQQPIKERKTPRPWATPSFERVPLNEALNGPSGNGTDWTVYDFQYS